MTTAIPTPPALPLIGHAAAIDKDLPLRSFTLLAEQYGEIFKLSMPGRTLVVVNTYELLNELCDERRFYKGVTGALEEVRNGVADALFTAYNHEENWAIAHRLLMPAFSTAAVRGMYDDMMDIASQLIAKWERFGPKHVIDPAEDFTRLTFDTIALCSMSYRLNSFYREGSHPFIQALADFLVESGRRANRPFLVKSMMMGSNAKYEQDIRTMAQLAEEIIAERKANPTDKNDLLNTMLNGKDPKTGKGLSDECIKNNLLTFLIAGHETTSSTLTFAIYHIVKHPEVLRRLREEIDEVLGEQPIQLGDISKLPYIAACLRETLRLTPTASFRVSKAYEDTTLGGGKYAVKKDDVLVIASRMVMRDRAVWGEDANEFRPERMLDGKFEALPPNAWQPFGYGMRACIGRPFAWQEAVIALACIFQKFDIVMANPSYELELKQTLTVKPKDFAVHAVPRRRAAVPMMLPRAGVLQAARGASPVRSASASVIDEDVPRQPMYVLYGSNTGTSESFAQRVASDAPAHGFRAKLGTLDSVATGLPTDGPVVVITASFEGEPADNAAHFVEWLTSLKGNELADVSYAVFGCGNRDWVRTYQRVPKLVDETLEERGGRRLLTRGEGDASTAEFFESFDEWEAELWKTLPKEYNVIVGEHVASQGGLQMKTVDPGTSRASVLRQPDAALGTVTENRILTAPGAPIKRHIEFELPEGMAARTGDYLAVLPLNPARDVHRVISHFRLSPEQEIILSSAGPTPLPVDKPISIFALLSGYVELSQPATTRDLRVLLSAENSQASLEVLQSLSSAYAEKILARRLSILDILEDNPDIKVSFETYLQMLPSMRIRQYSISSSPLWNAQRVTLTISVVGAPSISGKKDPFLGVASTYLAGLRPGDKVQMAVRASSAVFHPPSDPTVPMVMFAAGSGLAPMRGFLQERAMQKKAGREVAKSLLFFGCRSPSEDFLYSDSDLKEWTELGIVDVRPAFSRSMENSCGCKYVQDRVWHDGDDIDIMYNSNAKFYTCGSGKVAQGVKTVLIRLIQRQRGAGESEAAALFELAIRGRYATDIFE
ncbi:cytochrome P450 [Obba rivulosa]|uniref:Cytochrome P450 n=1 Tax=Obba rivulosa TaxID=1052685 RepID=A0A8E2DFZ0_9APHY|nr:cytochrome P450 [Obba rivulosa]